MSSEILDAIVVIRVEIKPLASDSDLYLIDARIAVNRRIEILGTASPLTQSRAFFASRRMAAMTLRRVSGVPTKILDGYRDGNRT